jgi:hypothetical protein
VIVLPTEATFESRPLQSSISCRQRFNSTEGAERITDRIIEEAKHGEPHVRGYLRRNLEFTKPAIGEIADILFRSECAYIADRQF